MCQGEVVREVAEVTQAWAAVNHLQIFSGASSVHSRHCQSPEYSVGLP